MLAEIFLLVPHLVGVQSFLKVPHFLVGYLFRCSFGEADSMGKLKLLVDERCIGSERCSLIYFSLALLENYFVSILFEASFVYGELFCRLFLCADSCPSSDYKLFSFSFYARNLLGTNVHVLFCWASYFALLESFIPKTLGLSSSGACSTT